MSNPLLSKVYEGIEVVAKAKKVDAILSVGVAQFWIAQKQLR